MNRGAVPNVVALVGTSSESPEALGDRHERCTQQFARSAVLIPWFPSYPVATAQSTAAIVSAR